MKNLNIIGVHQFLGEEGHKKKYILGEFPKHGALCNLQGNLAKKREEGIFERGEGG